MSAGLSLSDACGSIEYAVRATHQLALKAGNQLDRSVAAARSEAFAQALEIVEAAAGGRGLEWELLSCPNCGHDDVRRSARRFALRCGCGDRFEVFALERGERLATVELPHRCAIAEPVTRSGPVAVRTRGGRLMAETSVLIGVEKCGCVTYANSMPAEMDRADEKALVRILKQGGRLLNTTVGEARAMPNFLPMECPHEPKGWEASA